MFSTTLLFDYQTHITPNTVHKTNLARPIWQGQSGKANLAKANMA
jgi:hypothetical protein